MALKQSDFHSDSCFGKNHPQKSIQPITIQSYFKGEFTMNNFFKKHFKNGVTKIPKEAERAFFFYASMIFIIIYFLHRFFGDSWFK